jgi:CBS domain containing-hemolysin-like protein
MPPVATIATVMRPPLFVPGTRQVEDVLGDMKRQQDHLAIVLDEFGGTAGLVTMEDVLEELVGPIFDEHDTKAAGLGTGGLLSGAAELRDINAVHGLALDDSDYTTLGGLLFGQLGRLPRVGDVVRVPGAAFEIVAMDGVKVDQARLVEKLPVGS